MLTFSNPLLLWFFPILALPWIFRRRQEERIKRVDFPLLRFLMESEEKDLINPHLQELLLLILRTLILAILLLALAGPKWVTEAGINSRLFSFLPLGRTFQNNVIVVDHSYSLSYGEGEQDWWTQAGTVAEQLRSELSGLSTHWTRWDETTVAESGERRILPLNSSERQNLFQAPPQEAGTSLPALDRALRESFEGNENYILITDGQRLPWADLLGSEQARAPLLPYLVLTVGQPPVTNAWIEVDTLSSPPWGIAGWETIAGTVYSMREEAEDEGAVSILRKDTGEAVFSKAIVFPASPFEPAPLPFVFSTRFSDLAAGAATNGNALAFTLQLRPSDPLPVDNELTLQVPAIESFAIAITGTPDAPSPVQSVLAASFQVDSATTSPLRIEFKGTPLQLANTTDLTIVAESLVPSWMAADSQQAMDYIKNGGAMILFTGGAPSANALWGQFLQDLGWTWNGAATGEVGAVSVFNSGLMAHALESWQPSMWETWIPTAHGTLAGSNTQPLVTYNVGDTADHLIVERRLGNGRVWVVNTALTVDSPVFLSPILPAFLWEAGKEVARVKNPQEITLPRPRAESNLTLLTDEEKAFLQDTYKITFTTPETLRDALEERFGGTDLRMVLLFSLIALALLESWLANRLASI